MTDSGGIRIGTKFLKDPADVGEKITTQIDRIMLWLLGLEWLGMMLTAFLLSPRTWDGAESRIHPHLVVAIFAGPVFIIPAIVLGLLYPARPLTRHVVAVAQMLVSSVLIDITGGRIETHFHIFGSLAFLAFYRDWRVLMTASLVTALDHLFRGIWWPQTVYGSALISPWRWIEHTWWVAFEDVFLIIQMSMVAKTKARLKERANRDFLTGLGNRRFLEERFRSLQAFGDESPCAVLFIDLDRFKEANDALGHAVGDRLLALVATRLSETVRPQDTLARIGGDEFVVILPGVSRPEEARHLGTRLIAALGQPYALDSHQLLLSASVGISMCPDHGMSLERLQARADRAMYSAKASGRNRCQVFSPDIEEREKNLRDIGQDLHHALPNGQFELHFQPLFSPGASRIGGFEALLRWNHPVLGRITPTEFIPLAEKSGLITELGFWIMAEACRACKSWQTEGHAPVGVAVNVSGIQFETPDFPSRTVDILRESGLDPSLLTLEITETALMRDTGKARVLLASLRSLGVRIALDDFGTGYSSLSYLSSLPVDVIKLDRSFLSRKSCGSGDHSWTIVESVMELAHRLGLKVVGEGVETHDQASCLQRLQCDELQGHYFSEAIPEFAVYKLLAAIRERVATHDSSPSNVAA